MSHPQHAHQKHAGPYWRRAHRDWRFYVGSFLILASLASYTLGYSFLSLGLKQQSRQAATPVGR